MKLKWLFLLPILLAAGLAWRIPARASAVRSPGTPLSDSEMEAVYGGIFAYCGGPTCPNAGSCVKVASGTWEFFYNNGYLDCYGGLGGCYHVVVGGTTGHVPCYARLYAHSGCSSPISSRFISSNQPYCNP